MLECRAFPISTSPNVVSDIGVMARDAVIRG